MREARGRIENLVLRGLNLAVLKKSRLQWVDYLRGLAILLIVYRHVLIGLQRGHIVIPRILVDANMIFFSFRMPLFFILSGIFISRSIAKNSFKRLAAIKFENLLYPYLIWTVIQITIQIGLSRITNSDRGLIDYTYILYQPRALDQFWYLPALFNTTIVYLLVKMKLKANIWMQLVLGIILYFTSAYFQDISMISDWMAFYVFFALGDALSNFMFRENVQRVLRNPFSLLLMIPVFILTQKYYLAHNFEKLAITDNAHLSRPDYLQNARDQINFFFIALIGCLSMIILAFRLQSWNTLKFLRVLGYHSLYIYVMHVIITASIRLSLILMGVTNPVLILFTSIAFGVTIPVFIYNLLIKDNIFWFLFSYRKKTEKPAPVPEIKAAAVPVS